MSYTVRAATETAVIASISTPVRAVTRASAVSVTVPAAASTSASTSMWSRPSGWQSGMSSPVRLAARTPAMRAVPRTSPFGASPARTFAAVSGDMRTRARATARRSLAGLSPTSTMRAVPCSSTWVSSDISRALRGAGRRLRGRDQVAHGRRIAGAQQRDRVGVAVDDPLEEALAVLVRGQRALRPAAHVVEHDGERGVLLAEQLGDLGLHALRQRGRRAGGRDRDRERAGSKDGRQDEVAQRRHVHDVDEHRALLGVVVHADVDVGVVGRGDDHEGPLEVARVVLAPLPADRALPRELLQLGDRVGRDERHVAVAGEQALDLLQADLAATDDEALAAGELEAGDVEGRLEHVADAGLIADPAPELADALLPGVGGGRHGPPRVEARTLCTTGHPPPALLHQRVDDPPRPARVGRRAVGSAYAVDAGRTPGCVRRLLRAHGRARRPVRTAAAHRSRARPDRLRRQGRGAEGDRARAGDSRADPRRA